MIFLGTYNHNIDEKNRLSLPSKIVGKLNTSNLIVNKGLDGCLELWTSQEFENKINELMKLSSNKSDTRVIVRQFLANSAEVDIDKSNRILIPTNLRKTANLVKNVIIIGVGNRLEIWDELKYNKFLNDTNDQFEAIAERIDDVAKK